MKRIVTVTLVALSGSLAALASEILSLHSPSVLAASRAAHPSHHPIHLYAGTFPVLGLSGSTAHGTAAVLASGKGTSLRVRVGGLVPGSAHAIHVHAGSCAAPYVGIHLYVLGFLTADRSGYGTVQGFGPQPYLPGRRYVTVYAGADPARIIGCANLGPLVRR